MATKKTTVKKVTTSSKNSKIREAASERLMNVLDRVGIEEILEAMQNTRRIIWINFLIGTMRGLGFLIGTMIVVALLVWMFKLIGGMPLIGEYVLRGIDFVRENADLSLIPSASSVDINTSAIPENLNDLVNISNSN